MKSPSKFEQEDLTQKLLLCNKLNQDLLMSQKEITRLKAVISDVREINHSWKRHNSEMQSYIRRLEGTVCRLHLQLDHSLHGYQEPDKLLTRASMLRRDHKRGHSDIIFEMDGEMSLVVCDGRQEGAVRWDPDRTLSTPGTFTRDLATHPHPTPGTSVHLSDDITCPICQTAFPPHSNLVFLRHSQLCIKSPI